MYKTFRKQMIHGLNQHIDLTTTQISKILAKEDITNDDVYSISSRIRAISQLVAMLGKYDNIAGKELQGEELELVFDGVFKEKMIVIANQYTILVQKRITSVDINEENFEGIVFIAESSFKAYQRIISNMQKAELALREREKREQEDAL